MLLVRSVAKYPSIALLLLSFAAPASAQSKGIPPSLLARAKAGDASAEIRVGWAYEQGTGVPRNFERASLWYRKAAEQGNAMAQSRLGSLYRKGQGVPQDNTKAVLWWRKAAEQGDLFAEWSLGNACERGVGVPQDFTQAASSYRRAAEAEDGDALPKNSLGLLYEEGKGVPQDLSEAYFWTSLAVATMVDSKADHELYSDFVKDRDRIASHMNQAELGLIV